MPWQYRRVPAEKRREGQIIPSSQNASYLFNSTKPLLVPETGIEPVRPLFTKRRILSPLCLPISPLGQYNLQLLLSNKKAPTFGAQKSFHDSAKMLEARPGVEPG